MQELAKLKQPQEAVIATLRKHVDQAANWYSEHGADWPSKDRQAILSVIRRLDPALAAEVATLLPGSDIADIAKKLPTPPDTHTVIYLKL